MKEEIIATINSAYEMYKITEKASTKEYNRGYKNCFTYLEAIRKLLDNTEE